MGQKVGDPGRAGKVERGVRTVAVLSALAAVGAVPSAAAPVWTAFAAPGTAPQGVALPAPGTVPDRIGPRPAPWGGDGHRMVCRVAWDRLTEGARSRVDSILGTGGDSMEFAEACVWADLIRAQVSVDSPGMERLRRFTTAHYMNVARGAERVGPQVCSPPGGARPCILQGIEEVLTALRGGGSTLSKAEALRFLLHFVGDIHQPLHVGYGDDRGGNDVHLNAMGTRGTLHWIWDSFLLQHGGEPWPDRAARLSHEVRPIEEMLWADLDPVQWAMESYALVESQVYDGLADGHYVDERYYERNVLTAERRVQMAGVRLAGMLNRLFDSPGP